ncbi:MAG: methyltransferase [Actinomycetota bacterium]
MVFTFGSLALKFRFHKAYFKLSENVQKLFGVYHGLVVSSNITLFIILVIKIFRFKPLSFILGLPIFLFGVFLIGWGLFTLRVWAFYLREKGSLITKGPFSLVRHPIYVGGMFSSFGVSLATFSRASFVYSIFLFFILLWMASEEEKDLHEKFGQQYLDYVRRVPRFNIFAGLARKFQKSIA